MNTYNNMIHRSTNHIPNEIFYSQSEELFVEIKENLIKSFKYLENLDYNFSANEKCLLKNNFCIIKHKEANGYYLLTKNKVKKNKLFYKLCCKKIKVLGNENYIIEILSNYSQYNLKKGNRFNKLNLYT